MSHSYYDFAVSAVNAFVAIAIRTILFFVLASKIFFYLS